MTTDTASVHAVSEQLDLQRTAVNGPYTPRPENDPGRQPRFHTLISVDDHLVEPPWLFEGRLPAAFADRAPSVNVVSVASMREAVRAAAGLAQSGDAVLLSPACASFDQYRNFEIRGNRFRELVQALPGVVPVA